MSLPLSNDTDTIDRGSDVRALAWFLITIVVCCTAVIGYSMYAAALRPGAPIVEVVPATEMAEVFERLRDQVADDAVIGTQFRAGDLADIAQYEFHIYSLEVRNNGFLPAEYVRLDVTPQHGDILQVEEEGSNVLAPMNSAELRAVVLAEISGGTTREWMLTYYIWGNGYSVRIPQ